MYITILLLLFSIFKQFGPPLTTERESMLNIVIQWTIEFCPEFPHGHPSLHKNIGYVYWSGNLYNSLKFIVSKMIQKIYMFRVKLFVSAIPLFEVIRWSRLCSHVSRITQNARI